MKVGELMEQLINCDPEAEIILSKDEEGNCYKKLADICAENVYEDVECGEVEIGFKELTAQLLKDGFDEEEMMPFGLNCVILYPV